MFNKKIRICHITSAHPSYDMRIFQKECSTLATCDEFEVFLVAPGESRSENGVSVIGLGNCNRGRMCRMLFVSRKAYIVAKRLKADIYHIHDPELLVYAKKMKTSSNIVIFDSHENYPKQILEKAYLPILLRKTISKFYKNYESAVVKKIDATIIPGLTAGNDPFEGRCKRTVIIDNYPILNPSRKYIKRKREIPVKICYVGSLTKERGITQLVLACYEAKAKLILAGKFSPEEYKNEIFDMPESICVEYKGYCNYDEITSIYAEADIGAATLLKVGQYKLMGNLPTKTYEYMQVGLPIIMTDTDYNIKLMEKENFAYLVDPIDIQKMVKLINYIADNYEEAVRKAQLGYELVKKKYNWCNESKKLIELYKELIKIKRES